MEDRRSRRMGLYATLMICVLISVGLLGRASWRPVSALSSPLDLALPLVMNRYPPIPETPLLFPIDNPEGDGDYAVSWDTSRLAQTYYLEESWQSKDWIPLYSGPNTTYDVAARAPGTYAYRVQAQNGWGSSEPSQVVSTTVVGDAPGSLPAPGSRPGAYGGLAAVHVINDCPYALTLTFTGSEPDALTIPRCEACKVYSLIGPIFCPTSGRPTGELHLAPGVYRVTATVDEPGVRPYVGHWELAVDRRYSLCFYIVRSLGASALMAEMPDVSP